MANVFSIDFLIFTAVFLIVYGLIPAKSPARRYLLLAGSVAYMAFASLTAALWALLFAAVNFLLGICIERTSRPKAAMGMAVAVNALAMVTFKLLNVGMLGLSYYLFSFMSYLIDVYRDPKKHPAEIDPLRFASFSFFFPKFTQGPITRYSELASQLDKPRSSAASLQKGLQSFVLGFILKVLVSDKLGVFFREGEFYSLARIGYESISTELAWLGVVVTSLHIFIEWQAYMFMVLGLAEILGFQLPQNFNYPYIARTVGDYYRRWHMTLTRWFKDYIYIPLGGSRKGLGRTIVNVLFVWLVTSLWHGNGLSPKYVLWGAIAGFAVALDPLWYSFLTKRLGKDWSVKILGHILLIVLLPVSFYILRKPADGFNFILWGMGIGLLIVLERLWRTFVADRFRVGERLGKDTLTGRLWHFAVSVLAHVWVVIPMILSWLVFTITDFEELSVYFTRLFPAAGASAGADPNDFAEFWGLVRPYVIIGALFCVPVLSWLKNLLKRFSFGEQVLRFMNSKLVAWLVSFVLAGLFWYAVYSLIQNGSDPMGYAAF